MGSDGRQEPSYGIDAPGFFVFVAILVVVEAVIAVLMRRIAPLIGAGAVLLFAGFHAHTTLRGKFLAWRDLLAGLGLRGDERILDLGCGRGAVLLAIAKHLSKGRAVGIDIWSRSDQSGNAAFATRRNARAENVSERVDLLTADMTALPFSSESFDVVASSVAIHNIKGWAHRQKAIDEAVRVLRPGGRLVLADLRSTRNYMARLSELGMIDVARRSMGWRMWWTGPWAPTRLVTAVKPVEER